MKPPGGKAPLRGGDGHRLVGITGEADAIEGAHPVVETDVGVRNLIGMDHGIGRHRGDQVPGAARPGLALDLHFSLVVAAILPEQQDLARGQDLGREVVRGVGHRQGREGLVGVAGITRRIGGADPVEIGIRAGEAGIGIGRGIGRQGCDLTPGAVGAGLALHPIVGFAGAVVGPGKVNLGGGDGTRA